MAHAQAILESQTSSDEDLIEKLDDHYKWELLTDDAGFDTHYHTLREALMHIQQMVKNQIHINAAASLDGTIYIEHEQLTHLLEFIGLPQIEH